MKSKTGSLKESYLRSILKEYIFTLGCIVELQDVGSSSESLSS